MACCVIAVFVIGVVRGCWFRLPGVPAPAEVGFAPVARRAAPGAAPSAPGPAPVRTQTPALSPFSVGLVFLAFGTATYAAAIQALVLDGWVEPQAGAVPWWARTAVLGITVLSCVAMAAAGPESRRAGTPKAVRAAMLWGIGAAWWMWAIVDMHVFGLVEVGGGTLVADVLFHGPGAVMLVAAVAVTIRRNRTEASGSRTPLHKELVHHGG